VLGARLRYEQYDIAHENILLVQDVFRGSPAETRLVPFKDFILGTSELTFKSLKEFAYYLQVNKGQEIQLAVYNTETELVGFVKITPNDTWGGRGLLGADISFGYLNKLPLRKQDIANLQKRQKMAGIFNKLTSNSSMP
jgi:hypothetical protein